ncbi:MAG TPA: hypothetical protein VI248_06685 [Kineosporiaceae bacterium]
MPSAQVITWTNRISTIEEVVVISILAATLTIVVILGVIAPTRIGREFTARLRRRQVARRGGDQPATFACRLRPDGQVRWRRRCRAAWIHDVLLVTSGRVFPRTTALAVRMPEDVIRGTTRNEISQLGTHPHVIILRLDDGQLIELAAGESDRTCLAGPFLAAAIPGLRAARVERRRRFRTDHPLGQPDPKEQD